MHFRQPAEIREKYIIYKRNPRENPMNICIKNFYKNFKKPGKKSSKDHQKVQKSEAINAPEVRSYKRSRNQKL